VVAAVLEEISTFECSLTGPRRGGARSGGAARQPESNYAEAAGRGTAGPGARELRTASTARRSNVALVRDVTKRGGA
jgi:hypothetical protein